MFAMRDYDARFRDFKAAGKKFYQMFVGAPLKRGRGQPDFQAVIMGSNNLVCAGPRLQVNVQMERFFAPVKPHVYLNPIRAIPCPHDSNEFTSTILISCRMIQAIIGEISMPLIGGTIF